MSEDAGEAGDASQSSPTHDEPAAGARAQFRRFVGISLGGGRGKTTAVARLELNRATGQLTLVEARTRWGHRGGGEVEASDQPTGDLGEAPFRDDVLLRWFERWFDDATVVGFDAPLTLPPCVRCELACPGVDACTVPVVAWMRRHGESLVIRTGRSDPGKPAITPYTQRATELLLERATLQPREALGQGMGPLAARAAYLRRALSPKLRLHENLIEVHPRATLIRLFGSREERRTRHGSDTQTWDVRQQMLGQLVAGLAFDRVWPDLVVRNVHVFHAVVSAFTAYFWATQGWKGPEDLLVDATEGRASLTTAIDELGDLWLGDGWIWTPPGKPPTEL
jgi:predicted nuclease with RNAse H fold